MCVYSLVYVVACFVFSQSSNMLNQARLKVLKARDDHVLSVLEDGKKRMLLISQDQAKYAKLLESLIAQVIKKRFTV